jgi:hypothetical protein
MSEPETLVQAAPPLLKVVRFVEQMDPGVTALLEFHAPYPRWAIAATAPSAPLPAFAQNEFSVLFVPSELEDEWASKAEAWLKSAPAVPARTVRLPLEGGWLLWQPGRAAVFCPPEQVEALLSLLTAFSFYESELRKLEAEIAGDWPLVEADIPLAHDVKAADLGRQAQLGEMTQRTLLRRLRHVRVEQQLLELAADPRKAARLLQRKLRVASRLEVLDGQLETYEYVYELANQRMAEYANFRREYLVEWLIVVVLALEVIVVIAELFLAYHA